MSGAEIADLERLRIQVLYKQTAIVHIAGFLNACVYAFIVRNDVAQKWLLIWLGASGLNYLFRFFQHRKDKKTVDQGDFNPKRMETLFAIGVLSSGLFWSLAGLFIVPADNLAQCAFLGFVLSGVTAAAAAAYGSSMKSAMAFLLPCLLPFAYRMLITGGPYNTSMGVLVLLYAFVLSVAVYKIHQIVLESIRLRFEKDQILTELRSTQAKIINSAKMAALGTMAGGMAHEINTPLGILQLYVDSIANAATNDVIDGKKLLETTKKIEESIFRISKIVKSLVTFASKAEDSGFTLVPVQKILDETMDFCRNRFQDRGITLEIRNGHDLGINSAPVDAGNQTSFTSQNERPALVAEPLRSPRSRPGFHRTYVNCSGAQICEVLLNLLNNAIDAVQGRPSPKVIIETKETKDSVFIEVRDNGDGVPASIRELIMQPFFTTKEIGKGTGLGLSVALGIAHAHGGDLTLQPAAEGASFLLRLPRASD